MGVINLDKDSGGAAPRPLAEAPAAAVDESAVREVLRALRREGVATFLELIFFTDSAADLYREAPQPQRFAEQLARVDAALAEADRDGGERFSRKEVDAARRRYEALRGSLDASEGDRYAAALAQHRERQRRALLDEVPRHATPPGSRTLYGSDVLKIEHAAKVLGIAPDEARTIARSGGFELLTTEARHWSACEVLPGAPTTLAAAARALLTHEAEGAAALRSGTVSRWLISNQSPELAQQIAQYEASARQPGGEHLARHRAAWTLGVREIWWQGRMSTSPEDFGQRWTAREIDDRTVIALAQSQTLGAWFTMLDERVLEARASAVARSPTDRTVLEQLRWSLGVPWALAGEAFADVRALADRVRSSSAVAQAALRAATDGTLAAWLESLPAGRGDATWRAALAAPEFRAQGAACAFWVGVYRNAQDRTLLLRRDDASESLTSWRPLLQATLAARFWDALKPLRASGELVAFLLNDPAQPVSLAALPPMVPGESEDRSLNTLLWALGATGVVVEWGSRDRAVQAPEDLATLYEEDPDRFEAELGKGYIDLWLNARFGGDPLWGPALRVVRDLMQGKVSGGHVGAAVALCARRGGPLPLNPRAPLAAQVPGVVDPYDPRGQDWHVLLPHFRSGLALLWLLGQPRADLRGAAQAALTTWWNQRALLPPEQLIASLAPMGRPLVVAAEGHSLAPASFPPPGVSVSVPPPRAPAVSIPPATSRAPVVLGGIALAALFMGVGGYALKGRGRHEDPRANAGGSVVRPTDSPPPRTTPIPQMRCAASGGPTRFGSAGSVAHGATLSVHGEQVGVGWVVPGRRRNRIAGADDAAAALLSFDGQIQQTLDPEVPDDTEFTEFSPRSIGRVTVRWSAEGVPTVLSDEVAATYSDETIRCAGLSARWTVRRESAQPNDPAMGDGTYVAPGAVPSWTPELLQPYWCRTVNSAAPFVIAQQLFAEAGGTPERRTSLGASAADIWSPAPITTFPLSRTAIRGVPSAANPRRILKDRVADEWRAATVEGSGHVLVWRDGGNIRGAWLDAGYRVVGGVWQVQTNDDYSAPEVRMNGREGLLIFATRQQRAEGSPFRLAAIPLTYGTMPDAFRWLQVGLDDARTDHVSPSLALFQGRGWLLTFTLRPRREIATLPVDAQTDAVVLHGFDLSLRPAMQPSVVVPRARDAEIVSAGQRFLIASFASPGGSRSALSSTVGRCEIR